MSELLFDKLTYIDKLKAAGYPEDQARTQAEALDIALRETVATKYDVKTLRSEMREFETRLMGEIRLNRWMLALVIAATVIPLIRDLL